MKRIFSIIFAFIIIYIMFCNIAFCADVNDYIPHKIIVMLERSFSTDNPPKNFSVIINDDYTNIKFFKRPVTQGTKLYLTVTKISKEKIGKLDASLEARVTKVYIPEEDLTINVNNPNAIVKISKYEKLDVTDKSLDAGIMVANRFVKNVTFPAHFVKGAIKNQDGNMLVSGWNEMYDSSVFSYAGTGKPLVIPAGALATLTFYTKNANQE